jgi:hypothetical protein
MDKENVVYIHSGAIKKKIYLAIKKKNYIV